MAPVLMPPPMMAAPPPMEVYHCVAVYAAVPKVDQYELYEYCLDTGKGAKDGSIGDSVIGPAGKYSKCGHSGKGLGYHNFGVTQFAGPRESNELEEYCLDPDNDFRLLEGQSTMAGTTALDKSACLADASIIERDNFGDPKSYHGIFEVVRFRETEYFTFSRGNSCTGTRGIIDPNDDSNPYGGGNANARKIKSQLQKAAIVTTSADVNSIMNTSHISGISKLDASNQNITVIEDGIEIENLCHYQKAV